MSATDCLLNGEKYCYNKTVDYCPIYFMKITGLSGFANGDLNASTGEPEEHRRRMRNIDFHEIESATYQLETLPNYKMVFYEYDENKNYLSKYTVVNNNEKFTPTKNTKYVKVVLRAPSEKTMSNGQWYSHFTTKGVYFNVIKLRK